MKSIQKRMMLMFAVSLICAAVTANLTQNSRSAIHRVEQYAPEVVSGIVYDDWLVETHGGFHGDGDTLIRFDVTDPSVFEDFYAPPFESTIEIRTANEVTVYNLSFFSTDAEIPDPETAYWMLDAHGPGSIPWANLSIGLYYPEEQTFYWYESDT